MAFNNNNKMIARALHLQITFLMVKKVNKKGSKLSDRLERRISVQKT